VILKSVCPFVTLSPTATESPVTVPLIDGLTFALLDTVMFPLPETVEMSVPFVAAAVL
jgi:hypothetical protein